ncbi:hypothetical protein RHGRI_000315 [Rhododendron griersonianum]|uniref:Transposase n=1 Tax=Rhododendron griersonianum TaxID=479676 RepID=A0AAV6LIG9_9ERIC|nr:hypothetical protein RHGRI_000315 [Rhododendron griersonianum]
MAAYERARDELIEKNLAMLESLGIKDLLASLPALYRSSQRKGTKKRKSKVAIGNDEEFLPPPCEESFGYSSDDCSGSQAEKVKCTTKRKKKGGSGNRILRDSQGTREERHIIEGATSTPPTQPSTDHVEGMSVVAAQPTQLPCIATNNEDQDKEPMFVRLAEEFDVDFSHPHVKAVTDYMLNGRYSDYRHELYRRVKSFPTIEEAREHPDAEIDPNYWNHICDYMKTKAYIEKSKANTTKRSNVKVLHCCGSKSFVRRRAELKESEMGRIEFYKATHCKDGFWTSDGAEKNYNEMIKLKNQPVPEGETPMTEDQICDKVLGRAIGYVRGLGYGVRPDTSIKVAHVMRGQLQECTKRADEAERRAEVAEQRAEVAERRAEVAERRAEVAERRAEELTEEVTSQRSTIDSLTVKTNRLESLYEKLASRMDMGSSPTSTW